jgi:hypothetical protein
VFPGSPAATFPDDSMVTLTATAAPDSEFGGWTGTGISGTDMNPVIQVTMDQAKIISARFDLAPVPSVNLDIDNNGQVSALTDGVLLVRYLFGVRGTALTQGALGPPPSNGPDVRRTNPDHIVNYLDQARTTMLDVDGNGVASALQDGVMLVRYLFGVRDAALTQGAMATNAHPMLNTASEIQSWIAQYVPGGSQASAASEFLAQASGQGLEASGEKSSTVTSQSSFVSDNSTLTTQNSPLASEPSAISVSPDNSTLNTENSTFAPESGAVAAVQLSSASLRSAPWVADFLGTEEEDEVLVTL